MQSKAQSKELLFTAIPQALRLPLDQPEARPIYALSNPTGHRGRIACVDDIHRFAGVFDARPDGRSTARTNDAPR